jgi:membrane glycosyltransferase
MNDLDRGGVENCPIAAWGNQVAGGVWNCQRRVDTDPALQVVPAARKEAPELMVGFAPVNAAPMPPESHLEMPVQSLSRFDKATEQRRWSAPELAKIPIFVRLIVFGGGGVLTCWGGYEMYRVIDVGGMTYLKLSLLFLFLANFSWIALAFSVGVVGFVHLMMKRAKTPAAPKTLRTHTAVVMPIYNEAPSRVFSALQAIHEDVEATGLGDAFDWFLLSDTTDPDIWIAEERALAEVRRKLGSKARVFYRQRAKNTARKAGNIADFVTRWGGAYEHMLVLDADSLMTGHAIVSLAAAMEADPDSGIIQTLPLIINRNTLFARVQQFAARIYGPVIADGLSCWMGRDGNYLSAPRLLPTIAACRISRASRRSAAISLATISSRRR